MLDLLQMIEDEDIELIEMNMRGNNKGFYCDNVIALDRSLTTRSKRCVLAEELGHHFTTVGDITDQTKIENRKQERQARAWGYKELISIDSLVEALDSKVHTRHDLAEHLNVTEEFLAESIAYYKDKYGLYYKCSDYIFYFEPLCVMKHYNTWSNYNTKGCGINEVAKRIRVGI